MPVDPWGYETLSPDQGGWVPDYGGYSDGPSWMDLIGQGIDRAAQAYAIGEAGYPQSQQYPQYPQPQTQQQMPQFTLQPGAPLPQPAPQQGGIQLSTTTLIIGGLVAFAFIFGKRGR